MARDSRGRQRGAERGSRAKGAAKGGTGDKPGRKTEYSGTRRVRGAEWGPCPARGKHDASCICNGTGKVQVSK
jgi:hypothetical protein